MKKLPKSPNPGGKKKKKKGRMSGSGKKNSEKKKEGEGKKSKVLTALEGYAGFTTLLYKCFIVNQIKKIGFAILKIKKRRASNLQAVLWL
ncbi:MAG: hypothetical protein IPJ74_22830 [Saprospiraceae bacterium]|nr:hypothetical protein [Saprospiraceae bacterium]